MNTIVVSTTAAYAVLVVLGVLLVTIGLLAVQISKWSHGLAEATRRLADEEFSHNQTRKHLQSVMRDAAARNVTWAAKVRDRDITISAAETVIESLKLRLDATAKKVPTRGKNGKFVKRSTL